jgi:outer membrane protein OmpA-like peptidoglycan-associated protein
MIRYVVPCFLALSFAGCSTKAKTVKVTAQTVKIKEKKAKPEPVAVVEEEPEKIEISDRIQFAIRSANLLDDSEGVLDEVVAVLESRPDIIVEINGYTDTSGNAGRNQRLSARRAKAVRRYLVDQGVDERRLRATGHGADEPIAENDTREGRVENRRVEFHVLGEDFDADS